MSEIKNSLKISAPITPYDTRDSYPTHYEEYGSGGYRTVETLQDRNLIPELRRKEGMLVCVLEDGMWYSLQGGITNDHWVNFKKSIGLIIFGSSFAFAMLKHSKHALTNSEQ